MYVDQRGRVRAGDVIIALDGEAVSSPEDLSRLLDSRSVGDMVHLLPEMARYVRSSLRCRASTEILATH